MRCGNKKLGARPRLALREGIAFGPGKTTCCKVSAIPDRLRLPVGAWARAMPDPPPKSALLLIQQARHRVAEGLIVLAKSVLGGLHHEYSLAAAVA